MMQVAVTLEEFLIEIAPRAEQVFFIPDINPLFKCFNNFREARRTININLVDIG